MSERVREWGRGGRGPRTRERENMIKKSDMNERNKNGMDAKEGKKILETLRSKQLQSGMKREPGWKGT